MYGQGWMLRAGSGRASRNHHEMWHAAAAGHRECPAWQEDAAGLCHTAASTRHSDAAMLAPRCSAWQPLAPLPPLHWLQELCIRPAMQALLQENCSGEVLSRRCRVCKGRGREGFAGGTVRQGQAPRQLDGSTRF